MTVYQPIKRLANAAAELAVPLARGQQPPPLAKERVDNGREQVPSVLLDTIAITADNMLATVVADGFVTAEPLCTSRYRSACERAGIG